MPSWKDLEKALDELSPLQKGGPGSGHFGHRGRPGLRGGGLPGEGGPALAPEAPPPVMEAGLPRRTAQGSKPADLDRAASDPSQRKVDKLGGGVGNTFKVNIKDDGAACYKPDKDNGFRINEFTGKIITEAEQKAGITSYPLRETLDAQTPASLREQGVHNLDRALGFNVTPDMTVKDFGQGKGSALAWVNGSFDVGNAAHLDKDRAHPDLEKIGALDFLVGNTDRHGGNLIRGTDGRLYAPDNGLSFPYAKGKAGLSEFRSHPVRWLAGRTDRAVSPGILRAVERLDEGKIRKAMTGFPAREINGVLFRREKLLQLKDWHRVANYSLEALEARWR